MDSADFDRTMARVLQVSPVEMTFEDGMRIVEFLTSFVVMFRQAESRVGISFWPLPMTHSCASV